MKIVKIETGEALLQAALFDFQNLTEEEIQKIVGILTEEDELAKLLMYLPKDRLYHIMIVIFKNLFVSGEKEAVKVIENWVKNKLNPAMPKNTSAEVMKSYVYSQYIHGLGKIYIFHLSMAKHFKGMIVIDPISKQKVRLLGPS